MAKNPPANAGEIRDTGLIPGLGRSPGGGHGNPLQHLCLKNPMDRRAWQATVHRVTKSWTQLKHTHTTQHTRTHAPCDPHHKGEMQAEGIRALLQLFQWFLTHTTSSESHLLSVYHVPGTIKSTFQVLNYENSFCLSNHIGLITHGTIIDPNGLLFLNQINAMTILKEVEVWISCQYTNNLMDLFIREYELSQKTGILQILDISRYSMLLYFDCLLICTILSL